MKEIERKIVCYYAEPWAGGDLYKCVGYPVCHSQRDYGSVLYCSAMLSINIEKRAEDRAKNVLDDLLFDNFSDIRQDDVSFIDDYKLIGDN